jgi:hypothetical protein
MAYTVASLVTRFAAQDGPLLNALNGVMVQAGNAANATKDLTNAPVTPTDSQKAFNFFVSLQTAVGGLHVGLLGLGGIHLSSLLGLGSLTGIVEGIHSIGRSYMDLHDNLVQAHAQFGAMGLDADAMTDRYQKLANSISETGQMSRQAARDLALTAVQRGPNPENFEATARSAAALSAATGQPVANMMRMVNLGEENYQLYERMLRQAGVMVRHGASYAEIMERVNMLIDRGGKAQAEMQGTFKFQIQAMQNSVQSLRERLGSAIAGPFLAMLSQVMAGVRSVVDTVNEWVDSHRALISQIATLVGQILLAATVVVGFVAAMRLMSSVMSSMRMVTLALAAAKLILRTAIQGVGTAFRGMLIATGVGALLVLVGVILQASGAIDYLAARFQSWMSGTSGMFSGLIERIRPVWNTIKVEFIIVTEAIRTAWNDLQGNIIEAFDAIGNFVNGVLDWFKNAFGSILPSGTQIMTFLRDLWRNFTAELSVLGLRIRLIVQQIIFGFEAIPTVLRWAWDVILAFGKWFATDFKNNMINILGLIGEAFITLGEGVKGVFKGVWAVIKGGSFSEGFDEFHKQLARLADEARATFKDLNIPKLDLTKVDPERLKTIQDMQGEIDRRKGEAMEGQEQRRRELTDQINAEDEARKLEAAKKAATAATPPHLRGGILQSKGFQDLVGVWKKMQEQAAGGTIKPELDIAKKQLSAQQDTNEHLAKIRDELGQGAGAGNTAVVPQ